MRLQRIIISAAAASLVLTSALAFAAPVFAQTVGITVQFESSPLFKEANFLPGASVTRFIKVTNNRDQERAIVTKATNAIDTGGLGNVLQLSISKGATVLYSNTLSTFLNAGEVTLGTLGAHAEGQYDFKVTFLENSADAYQEAQLGFDILIGLQGEEAIGSEGNGSAGGSNGGGGGGGGGGIVTTGGGDNALHTLTVFNENAVPALTKQMMIVWQTNYPATSRVIYGTQSGVFDVNNPPNYGYAFSTAITDTPASSNGVLNHSVLISGLDIDTTYYYRVVSTASPPSISYEHSFNLSQLAYVPPTGSGESDTPGPHQQASGGSSSDNGTGGGSGSGNDPLAIAEGAGGGELQGQSGGLPTTDGGQAENQSNGLASVLGSLGTGWPWWLLLLLLLLLGVYYFWKVKEDEKQK